VLAVSIRLAVASKSAACTAGPGGTVAELKAARLRLTVVRRASSSASPTLACDDVVTVGGTGGAADLSLDASPRSERLDLWVEAFDGAEPPKVLATGAVVGIDRTPRLTPLQVLLAPTGRFACTLSPGNRARAFHSATPLPNGEVLLVAGITDPPAGAGSGTFALSTGVEIYDPRTGQFKTAVGDVSEGRAFHSAVLLPGPLDGPYDLFLTGGITAENPSGGALRLGAESDPLPLVPGPDAVAAPSVVLRYFPWADPPRVAQLPASPQLQARILHAVATVGGQTLVLGGVSGLDSAALSAGGTFEVLSATSPSDHRGPFPLQRLRVGAAAAPLSPTTVLLFGGNLGSSSSAAAAESAEIITLGDEPKSELASFEPGALAQARPVVHGTLTDLGGGDLLLAGGLALEGGKARTVVTSGGLRRLSQVPDGIRVTEVVAQDFVPTAYHAVAVLRDRDVLLVGGTPGACPTGLAVCGSPAAFRFTPSTGAVRQDSSLITPRFGQAVTLLPDESLLVTGGLTHTDTTLVAVSTAELYGVSAPDFFGRGAGKAAGPSCNR
jgi:hypothetical protein